MQTSTHNCGSVLDGKYVDVSKTDKSKNVMSFLDVSFLDELTKITGSRVFYSIYENNALKNSIKVECKFL